jgi:hypothetical protein
MCHYCGLKFGMLDTPLHVSQLKTSKIVEFAVEFTGFSPDACLCDKCFRFLDRKAKNKEGSGSERKRESKGDGSVYEMSGKEERVRRCLVRNCNREVRQLLRQFSGQTNYPCVIFCLIAVVLRQFLSLLQFNLG